MVELEAGRVALASRAGLAGLGLWIVSITLYGAMAAVEAGSFAQACLGGGSFLAAYAGVIGVGYRIVVWIELGA